MAEVSKAHRSADPGGRHGHKVHVQHGAQRRNTVGLDVAVSGVANEARRVPDTSEVNDLGTDDARRLVDGLAVHLLLGRQSVDGC